MVSPTRSSRSLPPAACICNRIRPGPYLRDVAREAHRHYPSMVAEASARVGAQTEINNLNGAVLKLADAAR